MTPETLIQMDSAAQVEAVAPEKVWDMMKAIEIAMLVTRNSTTFDAGLNGRPMSHPAPGTGLIYVLTEAGSSAAPRCAGRWQGVPVVSGARRPHALQARPW